jgi:hypothetical protein
MIDEKVKDLNLLLIYLTSWEEDKRNGEPGEKIFRAWKGYLFEILDDLQRNKLIRQYPKALSLILTDEGKRKAEEVKKKYF